MILRDLRSVMFASGSLLNGVVRFLDYPADGFRKKLFGAKRRRRNATLPKSPADPRKRPAQYPHRNGVCLMVDCANRGTVLSRSNPGTQRRSTNMPCPECQGEQLAFAAANNRSSRLRSFAVPPDRADYAVA